MAKAKKENDDKRPIIILKRVNKIGGESHGGTWKVAYADFVTSMMALFLLLWILSVTTIEQKKSIADYFSPTDPRVSKTESGSGAPLAGDTILTSEGANVDSSPQFQSSSDSEEWAQNQQKDAALDAQDELAFKNAEESIRQAIESVPELKELMQNLLIDMTPEGLRIQIVDQEGKPMFPLGSPVPLPQTEKLLSVITGIIKDLPNKISVRGHTDSLQYGKDASYTNWELSADRSNASRRVMLGSGLDIIRIENVQGKADREPLVATDLNSPRNRRISIILLKQSLVAGAKRTEQKFKNRKPGTARPEPKKREEGVIYFP